MTWSPEKSAALPTVVITCAVMEMEIEHYRRHPRPRPGAGAGMSHILGVKMMEQGLHNDPPKLRIELQQAIDQVERDYPDARAIVLGYGLCSRGIEGITTARCKLVVTRAHDCITLLLGDRKRYADYVAAHPGTYWYSPGWNKHHTPPGPEGYNKLLKQYTEQFGADNAEFLMESEQHWFTTYDRATYVDLTIGATDADIRYTRDCADWLKWKFDHQRGDPQLLIDLLAGPWDDERFLVLQPGQSVRMTADEKVMEAVTLTPSPS